MGRQPVAIVPHTHWDREWYHPFQTFRLRLVELLDDLLALMEGDPSYRCFLLDGQMAMVDDYLAVRPEAEGRLRRLAQAGRLTLGPWYVLTDEFLVSGETIVRNLQLGLDQAATLGGAMEVGYLPDMFGHVAQMPQLLAQAGMGHAVVWRGVPAVLDRTAFWWSAPDGSVVRAEYLPTGYGNGAALPADAKELVARLAAHVEELGPVLAGRLLVMNGTDHQAPQPWLGRVVEEVNQLQDDLELSIVSLPDALAQGPADGLPAWTGELRSGARANLLMGVASNRVDVKQAAARAELALERRAEPASALFRDPARWPGALLDLAWKEVVRNSAHDSVCACSSDEVVAAVLHRYAEARQVGDGLAARALDDLGRSLAQPGPVVVNLASRGRGGMVEVVLAGEGEGQVEGIQVLEHRSAVPTQLTLSGPELTALMAQVRSQALDERTFVNAVEVEEAEDRISVVLRADARLRENLVVEEVKADLAARVARRPDVPVHLRVEQAPLRRGLARVEDVPGFGWAAWAPASPRHPVRAEAGTGLANGLVSVVVDPHDGTFALDGRPGFDRLVDGGDHGDTYNYSPPEHDMVVDRPEAVEVEVVEAGPVRGRLVVRRSFAWPEAIDDRARNRAGRHQTSVTTIIELRAGERAVRAQVSFDNTCRDHRLRALFPLPEPAAWSRAETAFGVVERGLVAEGGPTERALPTWPSRRFVQAGGLTVVHLGLCEYELVDLGDDGRGGQVAGTLALTLLRATGMLSRVEMAYRPLPAGPPIPLAGPQMLGPVEASYALCTGDVDPWALADDILLPLQVVQAPGGGHRPAVGSALGVEGAEVSAVRRADGNLEVRVFNPRPAPTTATMEGRSGWLVDLRGRPQRPFAERFELGPWSLATVRLGPGSGLSGEDGGAGTASTG